MFDLVLQAKDRPMVSWDISERCTFKTRSFDIAGAPQGSQAYDFIMSAQARELANVLPLSRA